MNMNFFLSFFLSSSVFCLVLSLGKVYRKNFDCVRNPEMFSNVDMDERAYPILCTVLSICVTSVPIRSQSTALFAESRLLNKQATSDPAKHFN